ncbi:hypothetical protein F5X98DRAFT_380812 [Xylaria grammica]|nr:hypothetical protein F5X98DRAFT_380812 [Xylaria grammica]
MGARIQLRRGLLLRQTPPQQQDLIRRKTQQAVCHTERHMETATRAIARDFDKQVTVTQASAFYVAIIQQESLISVIAARCLFEALEPRYVSTEENDWVDIGISASKGRIQQLEKFGRYPTRNALLGRTNANAEEEFLKNHVPDLK